MAEDILNVILNVIAHICGDRGDDLHEPPRQRESRSRRDERRWRSEQRENLDAWRREEERRARRRRSRKGVGLGM